MKISKLELAARISLALVPLTALLGLWLETPFFYKLFLSSLIILIVVVIIIKVTEE